MPTRVDLELVRKRVKEADMRAFFEEHSTASTILPAQAYNVGSCAGYEARQQWARLVTGKPYLTYKRDTGGVYKRS